MTSHDKILESKTIVRFQDCDPFNHLNNSKYLDYFLNAREDQLITNYGLNLYRIAKTEGVGWVVTSHKIAYFIPAQTMEVVLIESQILQYAEKNLLVEMRMWDHGKKQIKAFMWSHFTHFNLKTSRSEKHADTYMDLFAKVVAPVEETSFDQRQEALMMQNRNIMAR